MVNKGVSLQIDILTEMLVALDALVLLGSIVDLLMFPKIVIKNIANMHRKHDVSASQNIIKNIVGQCFCQNIAEKSEHHPPHSGGGYP